MFCTNLIVLIRDAVLQIVKNNIFEHVQPPYQKRNDCVRFEIGISPNTLKETCQERREVKNGSNSMGWQTFCFLRGIKPCQGILMGIFGNDAYI